MIHHGDCVEVMAGMEPESVDAIVTDPPYGLGFMGKAWDGADIAKRAKRRAEQKQESLQRALPGRAPRLSMAEAAGTYDLRPSAMRGFQDWCNEWATEAFRVAKPSSYLLAFGGTRTVHRLAVAIEDAGWLIRDMLVWGYASGFPKSKASLKPAWEPIVMARKPGPLRMLNIDGTRLPVAPDDPVNEAVYHNKPNAIYGTYADKRDGVLSPMVPRGGRWPSNILLTDAIFDGGIAGVEGGGETFGGGLNHLLRRGGTTGAGLGYGSSSPEDAAMVGYDDGGTYSRFFLIPKAARSDREPVLGGLPTRIIETQGKAEGWTQDADGGHTTGDNRRPRANVHPTVKPTDLMRHLVRLVTPPGGLVLDPFLGSGTTAIAAELEGFRWAGIEREAEYVAIAEARLNGTQRGLGLAG